MSDWTYRPSLFCLRLADQEPEIVFRTREDTVNSVVSTNCTYIVLYYMPIMQDNVFFC